MDFPVALALVMQGRKVTRQDWPGGSWLELSPGTSGEAAHPVIAFADGSASVPFTYNLKDVTASDWTGEGIPLPGPRTRHAEAVELLKRVHFLRQNGERPPGAPENDPEAETWPPLDRAIEQFLQRTVPGA